MAALKGSNGQISSPGFGTRQVRVFALDFGVEIVASSDAEAKARRAFYSVTTTSSSFWITLQFADWAERENFNKWMQRFMEGIADGTTPNAFMTVLCPNRNFQRVGVPKGDIEFGKGVTDIGYVMKIEFVGSRDPLDPNLTGKDSGHSYFKGAGKGSISSYFYPAGRQIKGAESLDGTIFDPSPSGGDSLPDPTPTPQEQLQRHGLDPTDN